MEEGIMNKATSALIAAAALALSSGAYAQTGGGYGNSGTSNPDMTPGPATNQMNNDTTSGYGMPGATGADSGRGLGAPPNSPLQQSTNPSPVPHTSGPKSNNSLATPSVVSPADQQ
jgi:hypothetical protein